MIGKKGIYWLNGGIILVLVYLISITLILTLSGGIVPKGCEESCTLWWGVLSFPVIALFEFLSLSVSIRDLGTTAMFFRVVVLSSLLYFILGIIIGGIIGKIKGRKGRKVRKLLEE